MILDCESRRELLPGFERQTWRCGSTVTLLSQPTGAWVRQKDDWSDVSSMWRHVTSFTRPKRRTILWAHNLAFDMQVSGMFDCMLNLGWRIKDLRLGPGGSWIQWVTDDRTLTCVDSASVWPVPLATLAASMGLAKLADPAPDNDAGWQRRCAHDAALLAQAVTEYMDWLRREDLGCWQLTGAGQAWAHWRHRHYTHRVLAGDVLGAADCERRALWAGRAEAWRWGTYPTSTAYDFDWECAYATIAARTEVPVTPAGVANRWDFRQVLAAGLTRAVLAEVTVDTDVPVVPCEVAGRVVWPVGEFRTVLWTPELQLLASVNAQVKVHQAWLYRKEPALQSWAEWILARLADKSENIPGWQRIALKHWSRALVGRFSMRYRRWEHLATSDTTQVEITDGIEHDTGEQITLLQAGTDVFIQSVERESPNSAPMITGYVQSAARVQLWDACMLAGPENIYHIATDSLLVTPRGAQMIDALHTRGLLRGLRSKGRYHGVEIGGPNQVVVGGQPRIAGLSRKAVRTGDATWRTEVWRSAAEAIRRGELGTVTVTDRTFRARACDDRRRRLPDGATRPLRVRVNSQGRNVLDEP